jgi:hypothetical protein
VVDLIVKYAESEVFRDDDRDQDHDLLVAIRSGFIDEGDDGLDHRCVFSVQDT